MGKTTTGTRNDQKGTNWLQRDTNKLTKGETRPKRTTTIRKETHERGYMKLPLDQRKTSKI